MYFWQDLQWKGASAGETGPPQRYEYGGFCHGCLQKSVSRQGDSTL